MITFNRCTGLIGLVLCGSIFAGPKIEITPAQYNCGAVLEGKTDKLQAHFSVKNSGDALLRLTKVRPGCGCTVVKYDSLVKPGKTATIDARVNIAGYHSGSISKSITVTSNADNTPMVRLDVLATILPIIEASANYLDLNCTQAGTPQVLYLSSRKADLKITAITAQTTFKPDSASKTSGNLVLSIKYDWAPTDSVRADSLHVYKLTLYSPAVEKTTAAVFNIATDHPDKRVMIVSGQLAKPVTPPQ